MNKRKYVFWQITETITYPENTKFSDGVPRVEPLNWDKP
jgi:hypothetical protein